MNGDTQPDVLLVQPDPAVTLAELGELERACQTAEADVDMKKAAYSAAKDRLAECTSALREKLRSGLAPALPLFQVTEESGDEPGTDEPARGE